MRRSILLTVPCLAVAPWAAGQVLLNEDFESYANTGAVDVVWPGNSGDGFDTILVDPANPPQGSEGPLFPDLSSGKAVFHPGNDVQEWTGLSTGNPVIPTAEKSVKLSVDIYDNAEGNKRMSVGLRGANPAENLIELGFWNTDLVGYAHRAILFPDPGGDDPNPNWTFFQLDQALDTGEEPDGIITPGDVGPGWHTYSVVITPSTLTYELDLFRDGLDNGASLTAGSDVAGTDASITYNITTTAQGYNSLRFGGPSGVSSPGIEDSETGGGVLFDNIILELIDAVVAGIVGDYDDSGQVEQGDLDIVLQNWGTGTFTGNESNLDGGGPFDGTVDQNELDGVLQNWGSTSAPSFAGAAVPEPAALTLLGVGGLAMLRRRG